MKLGYFIYGNTARIALYHIEEISVVLEYVNPVSGVPVIKAKVAGPTVILSEPFPHVPFVLKAWKGNEFIGHFRGDFYEGTLVLTERDRAFSGISAYRLKDRETVIAMKTRECPGIATTDMILLSRKWEGHQIVAGHRGIEDWMVEEWDNERGIKEVEWMGRRKIVGYSMRYQGGSSAACSAALVALISGPHAGHSGWLLWGSEVPEYAAGIALGGGLGIVVGAVWLPRLEEFPGKVRNKIALPPESIAPKGSKGSKNSLGLMAI